MFHSSPKRVIVTMLCYECHDVNIFWSHLLTHRMHAHMLPNMCTHAHRHAHRHTWAYYMRAHILTTHTWTHLKIIYEFIPWNTYCCTWKYFILGLFYIIYIENGITFHLNHHCMMLLWFINFYHKSQNFNYFLLILLLFCVLNLFHRFF